MRKNRDDPDASLIGGRVVARRQGDHLVIEFPAHGLGGAIGGLLFAGLFAGLGLFALVQELGAALAPVLQPNNPLPPQFGHGLWNGFLSGVLFTGAGAALGFSVFDGAIRRTTITLTKEKLSILCVGVFGPRLYEWRLHEVAEVFTAPCGGPKGQINRKLLVQTFDGRKRGFLRGREHTEVEKTADLLRSELGMEAVKL
jgi:hypothetical protein